MGNAKFHVGESVCNEWLAIGRSFEPPVGGSDASADRPAEGEPHEYSRGERAVARSLDLVTGEIGRVLFRKDPEGRARPQERSDRSNPDFDLLPAFGSDLGIRRRRRSNGFAPVLDNART